MPAPPTAAPASPLLGKSRAQEICSRLMMKPFIPKSEFKDLVVNEDLRRDVETRLRTVGLLLVDNYYSKYFAVRLADEIERDASLTWAANFHLEKPAIALLVVLWAKLVFPKRSAQERREHPGQNVQPLFPGQGPLPEIELSTSEAALRAELGRKCGGAKLPIYLGQLRRLGFIEYSRLDRIVEGPLLDLLIDGPSMATKLKNSTLWEVLGRKGPPPYEGMTAELPATEAQETAAADGITSETIEPELARELLAEAAEAAPPADETPEGTPS
jgi:hypothetical protein